MGKYIDVKVGDFLLLDSATHTATYALGEVVEVKPAMVHLIRVREKPLPAEDLYTDVVIRHRKGVIGVIGRDHAEAVAAKKALFQWDRERHEAQRAANGLYLRQGRSLIRPQEKVG